MFAALAEASAPPLHSLKSAPPLTDRELLELVLDLLKSERDLFTRGGELVEVVHSPISAIRKLDRYALRERLLYNDRWQSLVASARRRLPAWLDHQILKRADWPGGRPA